MSGYSTTPLTRKLGISDEGRLLLLGAPAGFEVLLEPLPSGARRVRANADFDVAVVFVTRAAAARDRIAQLEPRLISGARLWICWPKKASGVKSDCTFDLVQAAGLETGLVDTKVCAVDETWSGLCFMRRRADPRHSTRDADER